MHDIDWSSVVGALAKAGVSQQEIAHHCGCGQTTISDLARGGTQSPRARLAFALLRLAAQRRVELGGVAGELADLLVRGHPMEASREAA